MGNLGDLPLEAAVAAPEPGSLLSIWPRDVGVFDKASQCFVITYRSRGIASEPIVNSGFVLLPPGEVPEGGWPVVAWAHGTTGVADTCAPSGDYPGGPVHAYQQLAAHPLNAWLACGYAVVAPDYQGLGTPGGHPYINPRSQLHAIVDAVRALRSRASTFSTKWYVMGHSQGGAAAIAVAAAAPADAPELELRGALSVAPGGYRYQGIAEYVATHPDVDAHAAAFLPIVLLGAQAADPSLDVMNLLSPEMKDIVDHARTRCLSQMQSDVKDVPKVVFKPGADLGPLIDYLGRQSIDEMVPLVPLLLIQGDQDKLVDYRGTYAYFQGACEKKAPVEFHPMKGADHHQALIQSESLVKGFVDAVENGIFTGNCGAV